MIKYNWYVIYTKPKCELKVANLLTRKNVKNYCPLKPVENQIFESKKIMLEPLFTSYVFVYIQESEKTAVLNTPGALNYLYWLNKPVTVDENDINSLVKLSTEFGKLKLEKCLIHHNKTNDDDTYECIAPEITPESDLKIVLPSLGYYIIVST